MKNRLNNRICYGSNTFTDTIMRLRNKNHLTGRNWKYYVIRRLEWYKDNKTKPKNFQDFSQSKDFSQCIQNWHR